MIEYVEKLVYLLIETVEQWEWTTWLQVLVSVWLVLDAVLTLEIYTRTQWVKLNNDDPHTWGTMYKIFFFAPVLGRNLLRLPLTLKRYGCNVFLWTYHDWSTDEDDPIWGTLTRRLF